MNMREEEAAAIVSIAFINGEGTGNIDDIVLDGTCWTWVTEDMTVAATLKEQLIALLGEVQFETLLPSLTHAALQVTKPSWPGQVTVQLEDGET